jgi:ferric-dicitrate binding protein FerR (iron transport regulator)
MNEHEEENLRRLLEDAGPRPPIPQEDLDAIASAARLAWRGHRRHRRQLRSQPKMSRALRMGLAALLAVTLGLALWWALRRDVTHTASPWIEAATNPIHLSLPDGVTARLDAKTRLRTLSPTILELDRGAVYVDTGEGHHKAIEVQTSVGTVRDIGTRFAVRIVERSTLLVRVRDGAVLTEQGGRTYRTQSGQELILRRDGTSERREAAPYGPEWDWVVKAAPGFDIEGRTLREFLDWVARETGWRIVLADAGLEDSAAQTVLHGSIGKLPPDQAPFAVLPGAGLEGKIENGALIVRRR